MPLDSLSFDELEQQKRRPAAPGMESVSFDMLGGQATTPPSAGTSAGQETFFGGLNDHPGTPVAPGAPAVSGPRDDYQGPSTPGAPAASGAQNDYQGTTSAPVKPAATAATPAPAMDTVRQRVTSLQSTTDPQQRALLQDEIGRTAFNELKNAGNDVSWDGDRLMVDGRAYVIGDGGQTAGPKVPGQAPIDPLSPQGPRTVPDGSVPPQMGLPKEAAPIDPNWNTDGYAAPGYTATPTGGAMPGWDNGKWNDPNHQTPKYVVGRILDGFPRTVEGLAKALPDIQRAYPGTTFNGKDKITIPGLGPIDVLQGASSGGGPWQWIDEANAGGGQSTETAPTVGPIRQPPEVIEPGAAGAAGVSLTSQGPTTPDPFTAQGGGVWTGTGWVPKDHPLATAAGGAAAGGAAAGGATATGFRPSGPTYKPGEVSFDDLDGMDLDNLMNLFGGNTRADTPALDTDYAAGSIDPNLDGLEMLDTDYQAGSVTNDPLRTYQAGELDELNNLGSGPVGAATEQGMMDLLANPESLDDRTIAMLKGMSREELATSFAEGDDELMAMAREAGIDDSNWVASERMADRRGRDEAMTRANRDVDLRAAETRGADTRSALALGQSVGEGKANQERSDAALQMERDLAAEGLSQAEIESEMRAAGFLREGETLNETFRGQAADRNAANTSANNSTRLAEASFEREGALANETLRGDADTRNQTARQQNIDNMFTSREDQRAAQTLATNAALNAAAQRGDRQALRESINQEAAKLGQSADALQLNYTLGLLDDATRRYGIDVGASLDRAKLAQAGREFQEDLAFRIRALAQADDQFAANYGLNLAELEQNANSQNFKNYASLLTGE